MNPNPFHVFLALMGFVFLALGVLTHFADEIRRERLERKARIEDLRNTRSIQ